jgi:hypothetical protein
MRYPGLMGVRRSRHGLQGGDRRTRTFVAVPLALSAVVTVVDIVVPPEVHLGPFLVAAPALTASLAGPRLTAFVGAVAVLAQAVVAVVRTSITDLNHMYQIAALWTRVIIGDVRGKGLDAISSAAGVLLPAGRAGGLVAGYGVRAAAGAGLRRSAAPRGWPPGRRRRPRRGETASGFWVSGRPAQAGQVPEARKWSIVSVYGRMSSPCPLSHSSE